MKIQDQRPGLFTRSECNIWLDLHIRQRMLEEYLNPQSDGASRNRESIHKTLDFIHRHIPPQSAVLDLGCGPGLYAEPLCDSGHKVTGIDFNSVSVEYASKKRNDINYLCGDYLSDFPTGSYDAILLIYCDFGALTDPEGELLLKHVRGIKRRRGVYFRFFR